MARRLNSGAGGAGSAVGHSGRSSEGLLRMVRSEGHSGRDAIAVSIIWQQKLPMLVPIPHDRSRKPASVKCIPITTSMAISRTQKGRRSEMCLNMPIQGPLVRMPVLAKGMEAKVKLRPKRIRAALSPRVKFRIG